MDTFALNEDSSVLLLKAFEDSQLVESIKSRIETSGRLVELSYSALLSQTSQSLGFGASSFDAVISCGVASSETDTFLPEILRVLKPGARLLTLELCAPSQINGSRWRTSEGLLKSHLLAGFINTQAAEAAASEAGARLAASLLPGESQSSVAPLKYIQIVTYKPEWEQGAAFSLKSRTQVAQTNGSNGAVKIGLGAEEDLIDEDSLLAPEDKVPQKKIDYGDCGTGPGASRKACKNCSCGRAELEATESKPVKIAAKSDIAAAQPASACGNCYLGDAFRCGGCPYRGTPPFKPGEKVKLDMGSDDL